MAFIGNDIVDLTDPANRGKSGDIRFLQRVFTVPEQAAIAAAAEPDAVLWMLWTAKEAAYKAVCKIDPSTTSAPRLYAVSLSPGRQTPVRPGMLRGTVLTPCGPVVFRVSGAADHVHCIGATAAGFLDGVLCCVKRIVPVEFGDDPAPDIRPTAPFRAGRKMRRSPIEASDPSEAVRGYARRHLAALLGRPAADIEIRRDPGSHGPGPPRAYLKGKPAPVELSLSHDGAFVAWATALSRRPTKAPHRRLSYRE